jgi:sarcosine oxidase subunit alpha
MTKRLPSQPGEWIDRTRPVRFRFEGSEYQGFQGDTLSSALWANGVRRMGRSFKYHRPRSVYSLSAYDANVIVESASTTNIRGDLLPIAEGLDVRAVNTLGGLAGDRYRIMERFSKFLPVGFYYKAFHTPKWLFPHYERMMRRAAGLGHIKPASRAAVLPKDYAFADVLVVGSGPTGLAAAIAAGEAGLKVMLVDEQRQIGGTFCWQRSDSANTLSQLTEQLARLPNVETRVGSQAAGWYADQWIALVAAGRLTKLRAKATIFATGAVEQPAVFRNNDSPGVMLASAAQRLIRLYAVKPFERVVVMTANEDGYRAALDLAQAGVEVAAIVDLRSNPNTQLPRAPEFARFKVLPGHTIYEAAPNQDKTSLASAVVCQIDSSGQPIASTSQTIACDGIVMSVGWSPNAGLMAQSGVRFQYDSAVEQLVPSELPAGVFAAGRANGVYELADQLQDGRRAAFEAAQFLGQKAPTAEKVVRSAIAQSHPYPIFDHPKKKNFIDLDEDLQLVDVVNAHAEGYDSVELLKRYSTVGMGPSQGKLSNMNAVRILARLNGHSLDKIGTTTARPFHQPVSIAHLAGRRFHPHRHTPMHHWHRQNGASMVHVGAWFRPEFYAAGNSSRDDCILNEALNVRRAAGLIDLSTLGKIHVNGPDAATFLDRIFTSSFARQKNGKLRYAMACDETGIIHEEGVVARLADDRFYLTASTAGADAFYRELQRWAIVFNLNVTLANSTGHLAAMNLAGPNARQILASVTAADVSADSIPFGTAREFAVAGVPAILLRTGFVGEISYEIHVPAHTALDVWSAILAAGSKFGIRPFGIEAQRLLRLEKGHPIAGHDTDALTTPSEANFDWAVKMDKPFFVGKRALQILQRKPLERKLVGISFAASTTKLPEECQLVIDRGQIVGRVTSIAARSTVGHPIGLAFVRPDLAQPGTPIRIRMQKDEFAEAKVTALPFYDTEHARQLQ